MNKNDDEDEDYMSDKLLENITDTRPGLLTQSQARRFYLDRKKRESDEINKDKHQPLSKLEESTRNEALSKSIIDIDKNNKGLNLMKKMGFEVGMALGKTSAVRVPIKEPINVVLKSNREGLGCDAEKKRKLEDYERRAKRRCEQKQIAEKLSTKHFLNNKRLEFEMRQLRKMFSKAQRICHQLDLGAGLTESLISWYWPDYVQKKKAEEESLTDELNGESKQLGSDESEDESETFEDLKDKFDKLNIHIRQTHFYCIWCTTKYTDLTDLNKKCPGPNEDEHEF